MIIVVTVFATVIGLIAFDLIDLAVAAMAGTILFDAIGVLDGDDIIGVIDSGGGTIALLFGGMVVARVLVPTGLFEWLGNRLVDFAGGSGKRLALGMVAITAPLCALLPNATVVLLLAPVVIRASRAMGIGFVPLVIVLATVSNAAGLLTLVGDPATFIVGSSIDLSFGEYLRRVSLGGLLAVLVIVPLMPWLLRDAWRMRRPTVTAGSKPKILRPGFAIAAVATLILMAVLFVFGDMLPHKLTPPAVAILAATLTLLAVYGWKVEPIDRVLADVDWRTLIFIFCMLLMVQGLVKTGALATMTGLVVSVFGSNLPVVAIVFLLGVGALSSMLANTPVVVALIVVTKGYFVEIGMVPDAALGRHIFDWPEATLPVFVAMMFGATLGGNATLIGSAANIVASGICARQGEPVGFARFARIAAPIALAQIAVSAVYVLGLWWFLR